MKATIEQYVQSTAHWEPIENGDFDTYTEAHAAYEGLCDDLGWDRNTLRIVTEDEA